MSSPTDGRPWLDLDRVSLRYPGDRRSSPGLLALENVSLRIRAGERVALVGPSGAGKSTVLALANTRLAPTTGTVRVFGTDPTQQDRRSLRSLRSQVGMVNQDLHLTGPLRAVHNVNAGQLGRWPVWRAWASLLKPHDVEQAHRALATLGIDDKLWERTDQLSGGERQRVAIARVLVQNAPLVLADEPVSALDPERSREVLDLLCRLFGRGDRALVVSLHAYELAVEFFDRIVGIKHGRIVFDRAASDLTGAEADDLYAIDQIEPGIGQPAQPSAE